MGTGLALSIPLLGVLPCGGPWACFVAQRGNEAVTSVGAYSCRDSVHLKRSPGRSTLWYLQDCRDPLQSGQGGDRVIILFYLLH